MILQFWKEKNIIMYIIEKNYKLNFNYFICIKFQKDMNFQSLCLIILKWNIW